MKNREFYVELFYSVVALQIKIILGKLDILIFA